MKLKLKQDDRTYIYYLKGKLNNGFMLAYLDEETRTYHIQSNYTNKNTSHEVFKQMAQHFIEDVRNLTQNYTYHLEEEYSIFDNITKIKDNVFRPYVNEDLILNTLLIIHDEKGELMRKVCLKAVENGKLSLFLNCLSKKAANYTHLDKYDNYFDKTISLLNNATQCFPHNKDEIREAFIQHLKISPYDIDDAALIEKYKKVFDASTVPLFLSSLGKAPLGDLCLPTPTYELATCYLSFKTLCASSLQIYQIREIAKFVAKNEIDFPNFYIINQDQEKAFLGVEKSTDNALEKVQFLFKNLMEQNYQLGSDTKDDFTILKNTILKSNLDATLSYQDNNQLAKKRSNKI